MSRTHTNDGENPQTLSNIYEVVRREDGFFDVFHNGELADGSIPDRWLEEQLVKYGICGEEYRSARRELDALGRIRLVY